MIELRQPDSDESAIHAGVVAGALERLGRCLVTAASPGAEGMWPRRALCLTLSLY